MSVEMRNRGGRELKAHAWSVVAGSPACWSAKIADFGVSAIVKPRRRKSTCALDRLNCPVSYMSPNHTALIADTVPYRCPWQTHADTGLVNALDFLMGLC